MRMSSAWPGSSTICGAVDGFSDATPDAIARFHVDRDDATRVALVYERLVILDEVHRLLTGNRIFMDRMVGVGVLSREETLGYAITGPLLRAVLFDRGHQQLRALRYNAFVLLAELFTNDTRSLRDDLI